MRALPKIGERVKAARVRRGITQTALAEKSGISDRHIGGIENNKRSPGHAALVALAEALSIPVTDLTDDPHHHRRIRPIWSGSDLREFRISQQCAYREGMSAAVKLNCDDPDTDIDSQAIEALLELWDKASAEAIDNAVSEPRASPSLVYEYWEDRAAGAALRTLRDRGWAVAVLEDVVRMDAIAEMTNTLCIWKMPSELYLEPHYQPLSWDYLGSAHLGDPGSPVHRPSDGELCLAVDSSE